MPPSNHSPLPPSDAAAARRDGEPIAPIGRSGVQLSHASRDGLLEDLRQRLSRGEGFALATLNLDHMVKLRRDPRFAAAYAAQDIVVADGNPVVWLSRLAGRDVELIPGSELVRPMVELAAAEGRPVSLYGATEAALQQAMERLRAEIPGLIPGLCIAPPMGLDPEGPDVRDALARIAALGPGLCLLALGAPRQERVAALGRQIAPHVGFASVGAGVEFISGHQTRAPAFMRAIAMEWLWRAALAPRRLGPRYLACAALLPGEVLAALGHRRGRS